MKHIICAMLHNHPGVLLRLTGLFNRRGFNIVSLTASETRNPEFSRMTVVVEGDEDVLEQVKYQMAKVVDVKKVSYFSAEEVSCSELLVVKVQALPENREEVLRIAGSYHARVLNIGESSMTLEATGYGGELDLFIEKLKKPGILEMARTGITALEKGDHCLLDAEREADLFGE